MPFLCNENTVATTSALWVMDIIVQAQNSKDAQPHDNFLKYNLVPIPAIVVKSVLLHNFLMIHHLSQWFIVAHRASEGSSGASNPFHMWVAKVVSGHQQ